MKKSLMMNVGILMVVVMSTGCTSMFKNIEGKSYNISASGIGGKFTTAVDPATGTISPTINFGSLEGGVMSHKPGDGSQITFDTQKSFWGGEIGSQTVKVNCKGGVKSMVISAVPQGATTVSLEEYDTDITTEDGTVATAFRDGVLASVNKNSAEANTKIKAMMVKVRADNAVDPKYKARFEELTKMPDEQLNAIKSGKDPVDNRLVGNEILWRVLTTKR